MATSNSMSDFEIVGTPPTHVNTPKEVALPVPKEIQKQRLTKPATPKYNVIENGFKFTRQG